MPHKNWTILELLNTTSEFFRNKNIENPRLNAEQLLGRVLNLERVDLYVSFERTVNPEELDRYRELVRRRAQHEPLQYLLTETEFMGLPFKVTPDVLIPRPETEILVEQVLETMAALGRETVTIADIGTGSGCIAVSLAKMGRNAEIFATDVSSAALQVARENSRLNEVDGRIIFMEHDVLGPWPGSLPEEIDILISNPPYIAGDEMAALQPEVAEFEPRIALTDNGDGLRFYRRLFELASSSGPPAIGRLVLEMSGSRPERIIGLAGEMGLSQLKIVEDLNKIPRVLIIKVKDE